MRVTTKKIIVPNQRYISPHALPLRSHACGARHHTPARQRPATSDSDAKTPGPPPAPNTWHWRELLTPPRPVLAPELIPRYQIRYHPSIITRFGRSTAARCPLPMRYNMSYWGFRPASRTARAQRAACGEAARRARSTQSSICLQGQGITPRSQMPLCAVCPPMPPLRPPCVQICSALKLPGTSRVGVYSSSSGEWRMSSSS
jgi:hypothetical protein